MKPRLHLLLTAVCAVLALGTPARASAHSSHGYSYAPPTGQVVVTNQSGGDVTLALSGLPARRLPAWQSTVFTAVAGDATLRASYFQFGADRLLQSQRLYVVPYRTASVIVAPERTARVLVENATPMDAQLLVDGRPNATFAPGATRVVSLPAGTVELALMAGGRTLDRTRMSLRAFEEPRWRIELPRVGDLLVRNPLPIAVQLVDDRGATRIVEPYGEALYCKLPLGGFHLLARRTTGEFVDAGTVDVRGGATTAWTVDAPRTGFVDFVSAHFLGTEVRIDGRRMASLPANGRSRTETTNGWHAVEVIDELGRVVLSTSIEVRPYDAVRVGFGTAAHQRAEDRVGDRDHDRDHHDRDDDGDRDEDHDRGEHHHGHDGETGDGCAMR